MLKSAFLALSLTVSAFAIGPVVRVHAATSAPAATDPVRQKLAEQTVSKLIPPGTYQKIMKDMMDGMAGGLIEQMMGMDASVLTDIAGEEEGSEGANAVKGKTMAEIAGEKDPNFKERMDITMKVMFAEMGTLMSAMEPEIRAALSSIYAKKYSTKELTDMNAFFATSSGSTFASNFMATFTDKEMMQASFGMMPKVMEAMPAIMKKVEEATAHLPPLSPADDSMAVDAASEASMESGEEPWHDNSNWSVADSKKAEALYSKYNTASDKASDIYNEYEAVRDAAVDAARKKFLAEGWKPAPTSKADTE